MRGYIGIMDMTMETTMPYRGNMRKQYRDSGNDNGNYYVLNPKP